MAARAGGGKAGGTGRDGAGGMGGWRRCYSLASQIVHAVPLAVGVAARAARLAAGLAAFAADWGGVHLGESAAGAGAAAGGVQVRAGDARGLMPRNSRPRCPGTR